METTPGIPSSRHKGFLSQLYVDHHRRVTTTGTAAMVCDQNTSFNLNLYQEEDEELDEQLNDERETLIEEEQVIEKEPMFEKPLTPSDVGKLNRLVIPKQHAEKYFPLGGSDSVEKGLLLSFEDELGKCWRFRYSYWNSSQSYVLTKGWSRFVKEKRLDAGDIVLFERHRLDGGRLFIGWRRRNAAPIGQDSGLAQPAAVAATNCGGGGWTQMCYSAQPYPSHPHGSPLPYQPHCLHAESFVQNQTTPSGNSKRLLRLFGVNMECQTDDSEPSTPDGSSISSQGQAHYNYYPQAHAPNRHDHMDINFSGDVNQMRYRQG